MNASVPVPASAPRRAFPRRPATAPAHRQRGMSLVETMITLVLGLIVVAAVYNMYAGTTRSSRFTSGLQSMQENGRFGVSVLQRGFRLAGYSPATRVAPLAFGDGGIDDTTVVVRLNQARDCNGKSTAGAGGVAVNTYRHRPDPEPGRGTITCEGSGTGADEMVLVENVEAFRVLYGIDEDDDDVPERYVPHTEVGPADENAVTALRFALLVTSGDPIRTRGRSEAHVLLDTVVDSDDRIARSVFASTVKLRNRR